MKNYENLRKKKIQIGIHGKREKMDFLKVEIDVFFLILEIDIICKGRGENCIVCIHVAILVSICRERKI